MNISALKSNGYPYYTSGAAIPPEYFIVIGYEI